MATLAEVMDKANTRRQQAIELKVAGYTYAEIGAIMGVSRQRVEQIISPTKEVLLKVRRRTNGLCALCGNELTTIHHKSSVQTAADFDSPENMVLLCKSCHKIADVVRIRYCKTCGKEIEVGNYCSDCRPKWKTNIVIIPCTQCGKLFVIRKSRFDTQKRRYKNIYCSQGCVGIAMAKAYGWGARWAKIRLTKGLLTR